MSGGRANGNTRPSDDRATGFASVVLDVDSTLCGVEGIDWLASLKGPHVEAEVKALTERAMTGDIALDAVYGERLAIVRPTRQDVRSLSAEYISSLAPFAASAVRLLDGAGRRVVLVSGGIREAILPVAAQIGIPPEDVHAVPVQFDENGDYAGFESTSPLTTSTGKLDIVSGLALPRRIVAMGDGATDVAMKSAVDLFVAFTGFVKREAVVREADRVFETFDELVELVLG